MGNDTKNERLVQKINFGYGDIYVYGEADFEANQAMQEPLEKLFKYERLEEKGKNNCKLCGTNYDFRMVQIAKCLGTMGVSLSGSVDQVHRENAFKFCPECGRRLTKENFDGNEI